MNKITPINYLDKFNLIEEYWTPKIVAELNEQYVKLAKLKGEFIWHKHEDEDELFQVVKGKLHIDFPDKSSTINEGEIIVVPRGVEHRPRTDEGKEAWIVLFEPKLTKHTGEINHKLTVSKLDWI